MIEAMFTPRPLYGVLRRGKQLVMPLTPASFFLRMFTRTTSCADSVAGTLPERTCIVPSSSEKLKQFGEVFIFCLEHTQRDVGPVWKMVWAQPSLVAGF